MENIEYDYFHGTYLSDLTLEILDSNRFNPHLMGGRGLFVTKSYDYAMEKGHHIYRVQGDGKALDLTNDKDITTFNLFRGRLHQDINTINHGLIYDQIAQEYNLDLIIMNQNVAVIKNLSSIKKLELIK